MTSPSRAGTVLHGGVRPGGPLSRAPLIALGVLAYVAALHEVHRLSIAPAFTYLRYSYREPGTAAALIALGLVVALALVLPSRLSRPSHLVAWTLFVVAVVPSIVVPQFSDVLSVPDATELGLWVAASFLPVAVLGTRGAVRGLMPDLRMSHGTFWAVVTVTSGAVYAYIIATVGISWELPSIADVYGVRDEFAAEETASGALRYLVPLLVGVLNPLIVARGLFERRWTWLVVGLFGQVFVYSFTGYRSAVLSPIALLGVYLLLRRGTRSSGSLLFGAAGLVAAMWVLDRLTSSIEFTSLLVRRFLITPGLLTAGYVYVFADSDKVALSHSFLSAFSAYPYSQEPPLLVGSLFFGDPGTNANANLMADGFANFGYPGVLLECLVLMVLLWIVDDAVRGVPWRFAGLILIMPTLSLADSGVFTTMLTHGFLAAVLACACLPRTEPDEVAVP
jgi:hypothetical protein